MKHVLVLNQFALPRDQGGGTRHIDLFGRLANWRSTIIAGNRNHYSQRPFATSDRSFLLVPVPEQNGGAKQRLASWLSYSVHAAFHSWRLQPDIVYASTPQLLAPLAGWAVARLRKASFVLEVRDLWPESFVAAGLLRKNSTLHRSLRMLEQFLARRADHIVVVTDGWESHFATLGANMTNFSVVPNGTEPADFDVADTKEQLRSEFGISGVTAIFAGAHGPKDGIDLVISAATELPDLNFILVGDGSCKRSAIERVERERISNVAFMDPVPKSDLARLLKACDIGIHSVSPLSVFELGMSPNKLFDYLATGLPVVSNAGRSVSRVIGATNCGYFGDSDSLPTGLATLRDAGAAHRLAMGTAGRELVSKNYARTHAANALEDILDAVLSDRVRG